MKTICKNIYLFAELTEEGQRKALEKNWDINVQYKWWDAIYCDAKEVGLEIDSFDLDRGNIRGNTTDFHLNIANKIVKDPGENCDTHKLAKKYIADWTDLVKKHSDGVNTEKVAEENVSEFDEEANDLDREFETDLLSEYLTILKKEYDYLTSEAAIINSFEANEYYFDETGKIC